MVVGASFLSLSRLFSGPHSRSPSTSAWYISKTLCFLKDGRKEGIRNTAEATEKHKACHLSSLVSRLGRSTVVARTLAAEPAEETALCSTSVTSVMATP